MTLSPRRGCLCELAELLVLELRQQAVVQMADWAPRCAPVEKSAPRRLARWRNGLTAQWTSGGLNPVPSLANRDSVDGPRAVAGYSAGCLTSDCSELQVPACSPAALADCSVVDLDSPMVVQ